MKRETARELLIPYVDGELDRSLATRLEEALAADAELQRELEQVRAVLAEIENAPALAADVAMRAQFDALLAAEKQKMAAERKARPLAQFPVWFQLAAAAALVCAGLGGGWWMATRAPTAGADPGADVRALRREIAELRAILDNPAAFAQRPASYRLLTMNQAADLPRADPDVVRALFQTLASDANGNVRLAAVEALAQYQQDGDVRRQLAHALLEQNDPVVQIALIQALVEAGAPEARAPIEKLIAMPDVSPVVKNQAQLGLDFL